LGSLSQLRRIVPSRGTTSPRPTLRMSVRDQLYSSQHDGDLKVPSSFCGDRVYDVVGAFFGEIEEVVFDVSSGRAAYALIAIGDPLGHRKLVAVPWCVVRVDTEYQRCAIDVDVDRLKGAPGIDDDLLPQMADFGWAVDVHAYFGCKPYWE